MQGKSDTSTITVSIDRSTALRDEQFWGTRLSVPRMPGSNDANILNISKSAKLHLAEIGDSTVPAAVFRNGFKQQRWYLLYNTLVDGEVIRVLGRDVVLLQTLEVCIPSLVIRVDGEPLDGLRY